MTDRNLKIAERKLLDIRTAASYLGLKPWSIRQLIYKGKLSPVPGLTVRKILLRRVDLDRLVDGQ